MGDGRRRRGLSPASFLACRTPFRPSIDCRIGLKQLARPADSDSTRGKGGLKYASPGCSDCRVSRARSRRRSWLLRLLSSASPYIGSIRLQGEDVLSSSLPYFDPSSNRPRERLTYSLQAVRAES